MLKVRNAGAQPTSEPITVTDGLPAGLSFVSAFGNGNTGTQGTAGPIVVTDTLPDGLTYSSASGADWNCSASGQDVTCTRANSLQAGATAPAITLLVAVGSRPTAAS